MHPLLPYFPLVALLTVALAIDFKQRRIPNWLNLLTFLVGVGSVGLGWLPISGWQCLFGVLAGFGLVLPRVLLGATGAGDLKQHMAVGAWAGPLGILCVVLLTTVIGGVIAVVQAASVGKLSALFRNSAILAINLVHVRELGVDHIEQTGKQFRSIDRTLPYALPMWIAVVMLLLARTWIGV